MFDFELNLLTNFLEVIDRQLETVLSGQKEVEEDGDFGNFDRLEHAIGLGFVACQTYMTETYGFMGINKRAALSVGPCHRSGRRIVGIINDAANYWKHHSEWGLANDVGRQMKIRETFEAMGCAVDLDYPLSNILAELADPNSMLFGALIPMLVEWRDELYRVKKGQVVCASP